MTGTVVPADDFDAAADAKALNKAMKGLGTDEKAIRNILCRRSEGQRMDIVEAFRNSYGKELESQIKSELSGNFERLMRKLITPVADFMANEVHKAIEGLGTDEKTLVEILCTRTNEEMHAISEAYERMFEKSMKSDIKGDTSGTFERLLLALMGGNRESSSRVDLDKAAEDAKTLYEAGEGRWGTDESEFVHILACRSNAHIRKVMSEYEELSGHSLKTAIKKEFSGITKTAMLAIIQCAEGRGKYFSKRIHKTMEGAGTREEHLIRIVVSRCEVDMAEIKEQYENDHEKSLGDAIKGETGGNFEKALLALLGC